MRRTKVEAPKQHPFLPGELGLAAVLVDLLGHLLEGVLDFQSGLLQRGQQVLGEQAVAPPWVVAGGLARTGGVENERAPRGYDPR